MRGGSGRRWDDHARAQDEIGYAFDMRVATVLFLSLVAVGVASCGYGFDSSRWKAVKGGPNLRERWDMYPSLINDHQLIGMTKEEIRELLGEPDEAGQGPFTQDTLPNSPEFRGYNADFVYTYWLGAGGLFPVDSDAMAIYFKGGRVDKFCWHPT